MRSKFCQYVGVTGSLSESKPSCSRRSSFSWACFRWRSCCTKSRKYSTALGICPLIEFEPQYRFEGLPVWREWCSSSKKSWGVFIVSICGLAPLSPQLRSRNSRVRLPVLRKFRQNSTSKLCRMGKRGSCRRIQWRRRFYKRWGQESNGIGVLNLFIQVRQNAF